MVRMPFRKQKTRTSIQPTIESRLETPNSDPLRPTKDFYDQDPYAAHLRNICLRAVDAYGDIVRTEGGDPEALGRLMDINSELARLGIEPEMHIINPADLEKVQKRQQLEKNPKKVAEWIAGQVRDTIIHATSAAEVNLAELEEHDINAGEDPSIKMADLASLPERKRDFLRYIQYLGTLKEFLDSNAGPSEAPEDTDNTSSTH